MEFVKKHETFPNSYEPYHVSVPISNLHIDIILLTWTDYSH